MISFGYNSHGELGTGDAIVDERWQPTQIAYFKDNGVGIAKMECGSRHALVLSDSGELWTWGGNGQGQCGHGTDEEKQEECYEPKRVRSIRNVRDVRCVAGHLYFCVFFFENEKEK